jgi:DNA replication and repair protein RecF
MSIITQLTAYNFRNLPKISIKPAKGLTIFCGKNASGKTSLLEAIYMLSTNRSFRSSKLQEIIQYQKSDLLISASIASENLHHIGIRKNMRGETILRIDSRTINSSAEIAELMPIQLLTPHVFHLLETGPEEKRKFIDWGVFHVEHGFIENWRIFRRSLKQRNAALKNKRLSEDQIHLWDKELATSTLIITKMRQKFCEGLFPVVEMVAQELLEIRNIKLHFLAGWDQTKDYLSLLNEYKNKDRLFGFTQIGPHRADLKIIINNRAASEVLSRGQQKLLICAMLIAQGLLLKNVSGKLSIYLIDDILAELDEVNRIKTLSLLSMIGMQVFASCVDTACLKKLNLEYELFHMEHLGKELEIA